MSCFQIVFFFSPFFVFRFYAIEATKHKTLQSTETNYDNFLQFVNAPWRYRMNYAQCKRSDFRVFFFLSLSMSLFERHNESKSWNFIRCVERRQDSFRFFLFLYTKTRCRLWIPVYVKKGEKKKLYLSG